MMSWHAYSKKQRSKFRSNESLSLYHFEIQIIVSLIVLYTYIVTLKDRKFSYIFYITAFRVPDA